MKVKCNGCNKIFEQSRPNNLYCSIECKKKKNMNDYYNYETGKAKVKELAFIKQYIHKNFKLKHRDIYNKLRNEAKEKFYEEKIKHN